MAKKKKTVSVENGQPIKPSGGGAKILPRNARVYEEMKKRGKKLKYGDDPHVDVYPEIVPDPEAAPKKKTATNNVWLRKYPSPKVHPIFLQKWAALIETIATRDNFIDSHLFQLELLCDLYAEYSDLGKIIRTEGRTYHSMGRQGEQIKMRPEVAQMNRILDMIYKYSRALQLTISADGYAGKDAEEDEWK